MNIIYRKIKEEDKETVNNLYEKLLDTHGCNVGIGCKNIKAEMKNYLFGFYNDLGFSICKKKNDSTYFISKSLERIKEIREDGDLER